MSAPVGLTFADGEFHYNLKTPRTRGCYQLRISLDDGSVRVADFVLR